MGINNRNNVDKEKAPIYIKVIIGILLTPVILFCAVGALIFILWYPFLAIAILLFSLRGLIWFLN